MFLFTEIILNNKEEIFLYFNYFSFISNLLSIYFQFIFSLILIYFQFTLNYF